MGSRWTIALVLVMMTAAADAGTHSPKKKGNAMFRIQSPAFAEGATIPREYTCEGSDRSPELRWQGAPAATKSFVLICDDPDAPVGVWTHWVAFDIDPATTSLAAGGAGVPAGMREGMQSSGATHYHGPCPPRGHGVHRYFFRLYAMDCAALGLPNGAARVDVERAMKGHVLAQAECMGRYERK